MDTKNTPDVTFEMHAINLLLATPNPLGRAYTANNTQDVEVALAALKLSDTGLVAARTRIKALSLDPKVREAAQLFAEQVKQSAYAGSEPHPEPLQAVAIVAAMKALDAAAAAARATKAAANDPKASGDL